MLGLSFCLFFLRVSFRIGIKLTTAKVPDNRVVAFSLESNDVIKMIEVNPILVQKHKGRKEKDAIWRSITPRSLSRIHPGKKKQRIMPRAKMMSICV